MFPVTLYDDFFFLIVFLSLFLFYFLFWIQVVKKLWAYIRENNLQDPKNRQNILCDESLRAIFRVDCINMFQMNKALTKHIWPLNVEDGNFSKKLFIFLGQFGSLIERMIHIP